MRPLTSQELEAERAILQRIKDYELDPANALQVPGAIPAAAAGSVGLAQKITDAIAALPQPATAQQIQQAIQAAQAAGAGGAGGAGGPPPLVGPQVKVQPPGGQPVKVQPPGGPVSIKAVLPQSQQDITDILTALAEALKNNNIKKAMHDRVIATLDENKNEQASATLAQKQAQDDNAMKDANILMSTANNKLKAAIKLARGYIANKSPQKIKPPARTAPIPELRDYISKNKLTNKDGTKISTSGPGRNQPTIYADIIAALA